MRKLLIAVLLATTLFSCVNKEKSDLERRREQIRTDKELAAKQEEERLANAKSDSLAAIAWGDAIWGMTKDEVIHTLAFRNGDVREYAVVMNQKRIEKTKETFGLKHLSNICALFMVRDNLDAVSIYSEKVRIDEFDELTRECVFLQNEFYRLYGRPIKRDEVSFSGFDKDGKQEIAEYIIGHRLGKSIRIILNNKGYDYWYEVSILPKITNRNNKSLLKWLNGINEDLNRPDDVTIFSF